nr:DUF4145 domain-containing protein [Pseudomonas sp. Hg5Tf]
MICPENEVAKFPCKACCLETNHKVVAVFLESGAEYVGNGNSFNWNVYNQIIQCMGCEEVSFRVRSTNSEDYDHDYETGQMIYNEIVTYYPGRALGSKVLDYWLLPEGIAQIYKEARAAVENELFIVGGISIRALLESICSDAEAKGKRLVNKIDDLHARSLVTKEGVETLHAIRVLGNRAAHNATHHSREQLLLALEVIEHILIGIYIIPARAEKAFKNLKVAKLPSPVAGRDQDAEPVPDSP